MVNVHFHVSGEFNPRATEYQGFALVGERGPEIVGHRLGRVRSGSARQGGVGHAQVWQGRLWRGVVLLGIGFMLGWLASR